MPAFGFNADAAVDLAVLAAVFAADEMTRGFAMSGANVTLPCAAEAVAADVVAAAVLVLQ